MTEKALDSSPRQSLCELIPLPTVEPGAFGGAEEARQKICDQVVSFVESWLSSNAEGPEHELHRLMETWRREMGRDALVATTLDQLEVGEHDHERVKQFVTQRIPALAWQCDEHVIVRMHPEMSNFYSRIVWTMVANFLPAGVSNKVQVRCNAHQTRNVIAIASKAVTGDEGCPH